MEKKKVLVFLGHEDCETLSGSLADSYEQGAKDAGHEVKRINICDLKFDPLLHKGYKVIQELEPDLKRVQEEMRWADHVTLFYPNWWGTMPAVLKGMFDRMFLPGFAFKFIKGSWRWEKLLKGKSANIFITMNTHPLLARILYGDNSNEIKRNIFEFAGFSPVRLTKVGPVEKIDNKERDALKKKAYELGKGAR
ncbi:MAG: NAD(P)H-dependent oxidoreductase [Patescibacteria group bacterium]|nr:NAD(P)H-dependent oxidoreductase [Patescibacteria group bacterium]